uniref:Uncharacterized protein n=1 Tax=Strigamia maritima TaxID=126957 RepID=T1ILW7_STRMM
MVTELPPDQNAAEHPVNNRRGG